MRTFPCVYDLNEVGWHGDKATCTRRRWHGLETRHEEGRLEWPLDENSKLNGPACRLVLGDSIDTYDSIDSL